MYNKESIEHMIHTKWTGRPVHFVDEITSTNTLAKELAKDGAVHGTLVVADYQSSGRGRFNRAWEVPKGVGVTMTLLLRPEFEPKFASMLTIVMGLSVAQAANEMGFETSIKWPNDVVVNRKKICGILTEMILDRERIDYVVIGTGINVNIREFPEEMQDKATSFLLESGEEQDRNRVIALVMEKFEKNYELFIKTCDLTYLIEDYQKLLANMNQPVRVIDQKNPFQGICLGINKDGELLVQLPDQTVKKVFAGEVSVRGLYSYV